MRRQAGQSRQASRAAAPAGPADYERKRDLPRLMPLFEDELMTPTLAAHARLLALMRRALRVERTRGIAGAWSYDLARHSALLRAYRAEAAAYAARQSRQPEGPGRCGPTPPRRPA